MTDEATSEANEIENHAPARWMVFGIGTTEPVLRGGIENIGASVVELLADRRKVVLKDCGPIRMGVGFNDNLTVVSRLVRPNVAREMGDDAVMLTKTKVPFDTGCAVLIYGDPTYSFGQVKVNHKGGLAGNGVVAEAFIRTYGEKQVVRVRVGIGSKGKKKHPMSDEACEKMLSGIFLAADVIDTLLADGYDAAVREANEASKGKRKNRALAPIPSEPTHTLMPSPGLDQTDSGGAL